MTRRSFSLLQTQVRERLGETAVADFWTDTEVKEEINNAIEQFTNEEKWHWLLTSQTGSLDQGTSDIILPEGVDVGNVSSMLFTADGQTRPYLLQKVQPEKGFELRQWYYFNSGWPIWYYIISTALDPSDAIQTLTRSGGSSSGTFTLTYFTQTTAPIARNATASDINDALVSGIVDFASGGSIIVSGGPLGTQDVTIEFISNLGEQAQALGVLGGTTTQMSIATTQVGGDPTNEFEYTIRVLPTPSRDFVYEYLYYRDTPELVDDADIVRIPDQYLDAVVSWATSKLWLKELNGQAKSAEQMQLYQAVLHMAITDQRTQSNDDLLVMGKDEPQYTLRDRTRYSQLRMPTVLGN
jgi:hypothetical protein